MYNPRNPFFINSPYQNRKFFNNHIQRSSQYPRYTRNSFCTNLNNVERERECIDSKKTYKKPEIDSSLSDFSGKTNNSRTSVTEHSFKSKIEDEFFEVFGLKIYYDDLLIICILIFLYQEGVQDEYLFISLILLLLT